MGDDRDIGIPFAGGELSAERLASGDIAALGLHGWLDNAGTWRPIAGLLPELDFVGLDFPGHGRSSHRPPGDFYHFVDYVHAAVATMDLLGHDSLLLFGHSMGAAIALLTAGAFPERVRGLILCDGTGPLTAPSENAPNDLRRGVQDRIRRADRSPRPYESLQSLREKQKSANPMLTDAAREALLVRGAEERDGQVYFAHDPRMKNASLMRFRDDDVDAFAARVACPTLVVRAEQGGLHDEEKLSARLAAFDDVTLVNVPGDHHAHLTQASSVAREIRQFLEARELL